LALVFRFHFLLSITLKLKCGLSLNIAGEKLEEQQEIQGLVSFYVKPVQAVAASLM